MDAFSEDNFGNEGARAYLDMLVAKLIATIKEIVGDEERLMLDEDGETMFMPSIEILALLCERYDATPPRPASVRQWHDKYLQIFDDSIEQFDVTPEFQAGRRKVIDNTFRWLLGLAENHWDQ